eukprot:TRINITY_DN5716_c1_g1_i1.p1 TRINITY_DN5716_c1_g1~~TRINITY_DN5716_c1_g1_i1.p1  ORF type:complete len:299 (+),score=72.82 TRINITY_DN5716_c1_g1_i1:741-1637(+)
MEHILHTPKPETIDANSTGVESLCYDDEEEEEEEEWRKLSEVVCGEQHMKMKRSWRVRYFSGVLTKAIQEKQEAQQIVAGYERAVMDMEDNIQRLLADREEAEKRLQTCIMTHKAELCRVKRALEDTVTASKVHQQHAESWSAEARRSQKALAELVEKDTSRLARGEQLYESVCKTPITKRTNYMYDLVTYCESLVGPSDPDIPSACLILNKYLSQLLSHDKQMTSNTFSYLLASLAEAFPSLQAFFASFRIEMAALKDSLEKATGAKGLSPPPAEHSSGTKDFINCLRQWRSVLDLS